MAGEDKKYEKRVVVMYDGIHYDAMVEYKDGKVNGTAVASRGIIWFLVACFLFSML